MIQPVDPGNWQGSKPRSIAMDHSATTGQRTRDSAWITLAGLAVMISLLLISSLSNAHNNPGFREDLLQTIEVDPAATPNSAEFAIEWSDKNTVQLIWRVIGAGEGAEQIAITVMQAGEAVAEIVGAEATTDRFQGEAFSLSVEGDGPSFSVELYGKVLDRSKKADN